MSFGVAVAVVGVLLKRVPDTSVEGLVKTCPDCAEDVKYEARVCKHCGYRFSDRL
ncbi:zinc ribbon domain-containing protein [Mycobacterium avium]